MAIERIVPGTVEWEAYYANHIVRYQFVQEILKDIKCEQILDVACGVGYGTYFLKDKPLKRVVGVDISDVALNIARSKYADNKIVYLKDNAEQLGLLASFGQFSALVSFETLEHLKNPKQFIDRCYSLIETGGKMLISSPNKLVSSPSGKVDWEFHEKEYTPEEFFNIIAAAGFTKIEVYGQQYTDKGKMKNEVRAELNKIVSNPFIRLGRRIQKLLKGHEFGFTLPDKVDDFEIISYTSPGSISKCGTNGPFVLIAVAEK
jgi:2-polyprenyl-3-methyl-5-hydroxy-6-metoxy-1,4-benzoquinol methylase